MRPDQSVPLLLLCLLASGNSPAAVRHVDVNNASPASLYLSWASAATNIQDAVDPTSTPGRGFYRATEP